MNEWVITVTNCMTAVTSDHVTHIWFSTINVTGNRLTKLGHYHPLVNRTPLFVTPSALFEKYFEKNITPDPLFEMVIFFSEICGGVLFLRNLWFVFLRFCTVKSKKVTKIDHTFSPRFAGVIFFSKFSQKARVVLFFSNSQRDEIFEKHIIPFSLFDFQNLKRIEPRFPLFLKGGFYSQEGGSWVGPVVEFIKLLQS